MNSKWETKIRKKNAKFFALRECFVFMRSNGRLTFCRHDDQRKLIFPYIFSYSICQYIYTGHYGSSFRHKPLIYSGIKKISNKGFLMAIYDIDIWNFINFSLYTEKNTSYEFVFLVRKTYFLSSLSPYSCFYSLGI